MTGELQDLYNRIANGNNTAEELKRMLLDTLWEVYNNCDDLECKSIANTILEYYYGE